MSGGIKYVGIDQSLTETGLVILDENGDIEEQYLIKTTPKESMENRLEGIAINILNKIRMKECKICLEGISFHSRGQRIAESSALHYVIRIYLRNDLREFNIVPPKTLKKWVTNNGNSSKDLMMLKIYKKWGIEFNNNNLADAYAIARYSMALSKGEIEPPKPKVRKTRKKKNVE